MADIIHKHTGIVVAIGSGEVSLITENHSVRYMTSGIVDLTHYMNYARAKRFDFQWLFQYKREFFFH